MIESQPISGPEPRTTGAETGACPAASDNISGEHWRWCPQCGHELIKIAGYVIENTPTLTTQIGKPPPMFR